MAGKLQVHTEGFRRRVAWRGPFGVLSELISNAFDESISRCEVTFEAAGRQTYRIRVEDDSPDGFRNLEESYTLYADSYKAAHAEQRGRFNYGEKVAIVLCEEACIESTTGTVVFTRDDTRHFPRRKRDRGTVFEGYIRCTRNEFEEACAKVKTILVPPSVTLLFNGHAIPPRPVVAVLTATLPTVAPNAAGELIKTERTTPVHVYRVGPGERATLYELGIPVVRTDDVFHVDVRQKVPLSVDRNNVTPGYLKRLRAAVLDITAALLSAADSSNRGVTEGLALAKPKTIQTVLTKRFGDRRFVPDFNREATGELVAEGYTAVPPNTFDRPTFAAIKRAEALPGGSQLRPRLTVVGNPLDESRITDGMRQFRHFVELLAEQTLGVHIDWEWWDNPAATCAAQCGPAGDGVIHLGWNVGVLGTGWFSPKPLLNRQNMDVIFHELGHHNGAMDCTREHCNGVTAVAAATAELLATNPELFAEFR